MNEITAILIFVASLALSIVSSLVLAANLDRVGARLELSEGLLGMLTALGADAPEVSTAVVALVAGRHDVGLGVVVGSNIFNLAALLGLSAVVAGQVHIAGRALLLNGAVAVLVTLLVVVLVLGLLEPLPTTLVLLVVLLPYTVLLALRPPQIWKLPLPNSVAGFLAAALADVEKEERKDVQTPKASRLDALSVVPALVSIVLASIGMVNASIALGTRWGVPDHILGTLVLATLTGIPNVLAAMRLATRGRGSAVVSEALNSNSLNVLSGICVPAVILGLGVVSGKTVFAVWWLLGMTVVTVGLTAFRGGLHRWGGAGTIALYLLFAGLIIFWP